MSGFMGIGGGSLLSFAEGVGFGAMTGGAGLAIEVAAQSVLKAAVSEGLQVIGQQLGLSGGEIGEALSAAGFAAGGAGAGDTAAEIGAQMGFSPSEQGSIANTAQQTVDAFTQMFQDGISRAGGEGAVKGKGGMSVLQAIAYAMGKAMDDKLNDMADKAQQLGSSQSGSSQYGQLSSEISADGQELGMLSSAVSNAIKSIGEAGSTLARKD